MRNVLKIKMVVDYIVQLHAYVQFIGQDGKINTLM